MNPALIQDFAKRSVHFVRATRNLSLPAPKAQNPDDGSVSCNFQTFDNQDRTQRHISMESTSVHFDIFRERQAYNDYR